MKLNGEIDCGFLKIYSILLQHLLLAIKFEFKPLNISIKIQICLFNLNNSLFKSLIISTFKNIYSHNILNCIYRNILLTMLRYNY